MWTVNFLTQFKIKYVLLQAHISPDHAALKPRQIEKGLTFNQLPATKRLKNGASHQAFGSSYTRDRNVDKTGLFMNKMPMF